MTMTCLVLAPLFALAQASFAVDEKPAISGIEKYRTWKLVNTKRFQVPDKVALMCRMVTPDEAKRISGPHDGKFISVYVNPKGQKAMGQLAKATFPAGTVIVKEKYKDEAGGQPELMTVMVKQKPGYNKAAGDWQYAVLDGATAKTLEIGKLDRCAKCHEQKKHSDYVFGNYLLQSEGKTGTSTTNL
jgi:hypothetical protein